MQHGVPQRGELIKRTCNVTCELVCNHDVTLLLVCSEDADHTDEPGPGDQHFHYDQTQNVYWLAGLPRET